MIRIMLSMSGSSIPKELFDYFQKDSSYVSTSAFVQQREKIKPELFKALFDKFNSLFCDDKTYNGYHLYAVDGSDAIIAKNPDAKDSYLEQGFNQLHINALFDLMNKTYKDVIIQPVHKANERRSAVIMCERNAFPKNSILIADRGYEAYNLYEHINRNPNLDYLIRVRNSLTTEIRNLPMRELDIIFTTELRTSQTKAYKEAFSKGTAKWISDPNKNSKAKVQNTWDFESPCKLTFRIVRFEISDDSYETIVTSLPKDKFSTSAIKELYHLRWGIETSFRELKYAIGLTSFHAKKEEYIYQEVYARMVMYNFCERITMNVVISQDASRKHVYQVNFTMAIHLCREFFALRINGPPGTPEKLIRKYTLPVRKGRQDKRKLKPKSVVNFIYRVA